MAQYPPPPGAEQHYTSLYPQSPPDGTQQMLDQSTHDLQFANLNQSIFPKSEGNGIDHGNSPPMEQLSAELHHATHQRSHQEQDQQHQLDMQQLHPLSLEEQQRQQIQQVAQHVQQHASLPQSPPGLVMTPSGHSSTANDAQKANRLRKACDSCSIRKVKCDESGPPCRACAALDIPCTFERPSRRRGPPNRHAEAIKRRRLEEPHQTGDSPQFLSTSSPASPTHAAQALAALSSATSGAQVSAESICPFEVLNPLIDDFFTYIHPLCPFPHEPSFREAWKRREDLSNKSFLALLASMIGALVSSFPRKPRLHFKAHQLEHLFPTHMSLVNRCQQVCGLARGPGYLENENLNVYDAATSYFLALMGTYTFRWRQGRLYFSECLTIIRTLGLHRTRDNSFPQLDGAVISSGSGNSGNEPGQDQPVDNITIEMGRRIFWTMFVSVKSIEQLGASFGELFIPPPTSSQPHPPFPAEVDDFCIFPTHNEPQPAGLLPIIAGFNANVRVFSSYNKLANLEVAWGMDVVVDWQRQERVLQESLQRCRASVDDMPSELKVHASHGPFAEPPPANGGGVFHSPQDRRRMQYEIQKANIYASSLSTRLYLIEKYFNLCDVRDRSKANPTSSPSSPTRGLIAASIDRAVPQPAPPTSHYDAAGDEMKQERETIIKDLLTVLGSINRVNMEPNAESFTMKIRSIASTLLDLPSEHRGEIPPQAQEYLAAFVKILMQLEHASPANGSRDQLEDEEAELRHWADLREYQLKFAQQGGLLGLL